MPSPCGQTTANKKSADSLYDPYKWHGPQTPLKMFLKIPQKFHDKAVQSNILWLNLNKISILQSADKQGNPSFHFHAPGSKRRYQWYSNSLGCLKIFPLSAPVLYWLSHLTCISSLKAKNERKTLIYTQLKISRYNPYFFAIFRRILRNWPPTYLLKSDHKEGRSLRTVNGCAPKVVSQK